MTTQYNVQEIRGGIVVAPPRLHAETIKPKKSVKTRSLFGRRNKKQASKRRDLISGSIEQAITPEMGAHRKTHARTPLLADVEEPEQDFARWDASGPIHSVNPGSHDGVPGGSALPSKSSSRQRSQSPGRLLGRISKAKKKRSKKKQSRRSQNEEDIPPPPKLTTPSSSNRTERTYQDCSSIDASIISCRSEELTTISESADVKDQQQEAAKPSEAAPTVSRRRRSLTAAFSIFAMDKTDRADGADSSEFSSIRSGSVSFGSDNHVPPVNPKPRKGPIALGSYLEQPTDSRPRRVSSGLMMDSGGSKGPRPKDKGYIMSFLGSGKSDDSDDEEDEEEPNNGLKTSDVKTEESPSLIASTTTGTTKSKGEGEHKDQQQTFDDDESHASTIISRGLTYLEKFYEECT
eukprot:scaffold437_cov111-Cylindrotheca_fusiformis.AAC.14